MFKKELRDTLKVLVHCLGVFLVYPILRALDWDLGYPQWDFKGVGDFLYTIFAVVFAGYSGVALFSSEKVDGAMEYLFSLPVSRRYILASKIGSRLSALLAVYVVGLLAGTLTNAAADGLSLLFLFCFAVSVGLAVDSVFLGLLGVLLFQFTLYFSSLTLQFVQAGMGTSFEPAGVAVCLLLPGLVLAVPALSAFWITFERMDLKPREYHAKPYLLIALPPLILLLAFVVINHRSFTGWVKLY